MEKEKNLKIFFIKLISIIVAIIIAINVLVNSLVSNVDFLNNILSLTELDARREQADNLRKDLNSLLEKDNIINEEDRILLYKLYKKLKSEFEEIN
tara:strand:+ start:309 stop:596 length:288 start_codon:yes stop_codon:yes gene_type:complete